jgi:hypothetical protein
MINPIIPATIATICAFDLVDDGTDNGPLAPPGPPGLPGIGDMEFSVFVKDFDFDFVVYFDLRGILLFLFYLLHNIFIR